MYAALMLAADRTLPVRFAILMSLLHPHPDDSSDEEDEEELDELGLLAAAVCVAGVEEVHVHHAKNRLPLRRYL